MIGRLLKSRYELVGLIQDGPIFSTYSGRDRIQGRDLSVRVLKAPFAQERDFIERLAATVQKFNVIQSASVERLTGVETDDGVTYVIGDLTRGPTLADRIRKLAPFSIPVSVGTAISILHALDSIHRTGLVHGDLNPQNLAVMADGDVRLQLTGVWEAYSSSATAGVLVLPSMAPYLAPEVSAGSLPSSRSDVYAVGILLYELVSGKSPYQAETPLALAFQHSTAPTPSLRSISLAVPPVLDEIVKKAMSKDPSRRYMSAGDMLADLRMLQDSLRFGRSLSWPLRPEPAEAAPTRGGRSHSGRPQPVAPKMSAIRRKGDEQASNRVRRRERDVPVWMQIIFLVGLVLFSACLGMWFYMNMSRTNWVRVPNIKNRSVTDATNLLRDNKLTLRVTRREPSDKIEQDVIMDVDPEPGSKIPEGGQVQVTVSSGTRNVAVPELRGLTVDKAKALLGNLNLAVDQQITTVTDPKLAAGLIIRSDPDARTLVERQTLVRLFVSSGSGDTPPDNSENGQSAGQDNTQGTQDNSQGNRQDNSQDNTQDAPQDNPNRYTFTLRLRLHDLPHPTVVRVDMEDDSGVRTVYEVTHSSGEKFNIRAKGPDSHATFTIYYDGMEVKKLEKDAEPRVRHRAPKPPDAGDQNDNNDSSNQGSTGQ